VAWLSLRGQRLLDVSAVLFDKDGTLSISHPLLHRLGLARVQACRSRLPGSLQRPGEALLRTVYGLNNQGVASTGVLAVGSRHDNLIATAAALSQQGAPWAHALEMSHQAFTEADVLLHGQHGPVASLSEGAESLLQDLHRSGVRCAVISNDSRLGVERFLDHHNLLPLMAAIWSADDQPRKPDPAAVHALCQQLGSTVERSVLISDADSDLIMARRAGLPLALAYLAGWRRPPCLSEEHVAIGHWGELTVDDCA